MAPSPKSRLEASLCENCYEVFFSKKAFDHHGKVCSQSQTATEARAAISRSSVLSKCDKCRRIFLGKDNLAQHVTREHNKKVFVLKSVVSCNICKKLFMENGLLEKHRRQAHPEAEAAIGAAVPLSTIIASAAVGAPKADGGGCRKAAASSEGGAAAQAESGEPPPAAAEAVPGPAAEAEPAAEAGAEPERSVGAGGDAVGGPRDASGGERPAATEDCAAVPAAADSPAESDTPPAEKDSQAERDTEPAEANSQSGGDASLGETDCRTGDAESAETSRQVDGDADPIQTEKQAGDDAESARADSEAGGDAKPGKTDEQAGGDAEPAKAARQAGRGKIVGKMLAKVGGEGVLFACGSCSLMVDNKDMLMKHLMEKHGHGAVVSTVPKPPPSAQAADSQTPSKSAAGVAQATMFACGLCNAKYDTVELVRYHITSAHGSASKLRLALGGKTPPAPPTRPEPESVWSTVECVVCSSLFRPSVRLRDVFMSLAEWTSHFYGRHQRLDKATSRKRLELRPCHRCGLVFLNKLTRMHHNVIAHSGQDPEEELKQRQRTEITASPAVAPTAQIAPKALTAKARSRVIVDSLMRASLVSRSAPTVVMDRETARRVQKRVFAAHATGQQRVTNVVFKCSKCGGMFPDDPSFERHAREAHQGEGKARGKSGGGGGSGGAPASSPSPRPPDPPPAVDTGQWSVLDQRECAECSKLMESCPRSFALFVRRAVWEQHVNEVHATGRWRCTGERLRLHPCAQCPRLFLHPSTLEAHKTKLHDTMAGAVTQAEADACELLATIECSRCSQLVQNADGIRFVEHSAWEKHFHGDHTELLLCDGRAGDWQLFRCAKCPRLFFSERDVAMHEARQAYMHMPMPINAKVTTLKLGGRGAQEETEILYQCANGECRFTSKEHDGMVEHFQQCRRDNPAETGETLLYKTVLVKKGPKRRPRKTSSGARRTKPNRRLENVLKKLDPGRSEPEGAAAEAPRPAPADGLAVLELDPVTSEPRSSHPVVLAAEDVPEAAAEEVTVAAEEEVSAGEAPADGEAAGRGAFRMDFACSVCSMRGSSKEEIALHIKRMHKEADASAVRRGMSEQERQKQVDGYKSAYLCAECKRMAEPCERTRDLYFEKAAWLRHLSSSHEPLGFSELDRLELHECDDCERLFLSAASLKRHAKCYHEEGAEHRDFRRPDLEERTPKHKFSCVEEGCDFQYHRVTRLRSHLITEHNFDLAVREVVFKTEDDFQEWKKTLELNTNALYIMRSNVQAKRKKGTYNVRYFVCSRVMAHLPAYKENGKKKTQRWQVNLLKRDMVWRCPAFMKAEVAVGQTDEPGIRVSFCPNHYGHEMDASFGRLSDQDEAEIGGMLRAGMSIPDVLKRMREEGRQQGTPNRKQRVTEMEINRIYEKYIGLRAPKAKRFGGALDRLRARGGKAAAAAAAVAAAGAGRTTVSWNAELVASDDVGDAEPETSLDEADRSADLDEEVAAPGTGDSWQRVCGEEDCQFTTNSVGHLRYHLRSRHGFAMHIDSAGFANMKEFAKWKRSLEKRTCARYTCYKCVSASSPDDPVDTRYFTCHRSGLNSLKRSPAQAPAPRRLVLCTGYMKVRCDRVSGEVACEYCASHYGHDARLVAGRAPPPLLEADYGAGEEEEAVSQSPSPVRRYSYVRAEEAYSPPSAASTPERPPRRGRPPKKRPAAPRRSRGGKRRRWEEMEVDEDDDDDDYREDDDEAMFESD